MELPVKLFLKIFMVRLLEIHPPVLRLPRIFLEVAFRMPPLANPRFQTTQLFPFSILSFFLLRGAYNISPL